MSTYIERYLYIYKHYILYSVHISCEYIYNIYTSTCAHGRPPLGSMSCPSWALSSWECCSKEFAEISSGNVCLTSFSSERHVCECHLLTVFCSGLVPCFFSSLPQASILSTNVIARILLHIVLLQNMSMLLAIKMVAQSEKFVLQTPNLASVRYSHAFF